MAFNIDESTFSHGINVGFGYPYFYGTGPAKIRGSSYMEGPTFIGQMFSFPWIMGTCMIGPQFNLDSYPPFDPFAFVLGTNWSPHSLNVIGDIAVRDHISVSLGVWSGFGVFSQYLVYSQSIIYTPGVVYAGALVFGGIVASPGHVLSMKKNLPFDMPHPTKEGWRLRYVCLEGPEIGVYKHGKASGKVFDMPDYWTKLVKQETITVQLTPIGKPRYLGVEKVEDNKVYVSGDEPGEYYYLLHAARYDDDLIVEYEGESHLDYPGGNEGYSFSFENDNMERIVKEVVREKLEKIELKDN